MHLLLILALPLLVLSTHLHLSLPTTPTLNPSSLPPSTRATLTTLGHHLSAPLRLSNDFSFRNVSSGSYLLEVHCPTFAFRPLRVDVVSSLGGDGGDIKDNGKGEKVEVWTTFRGNEWGNKGEVIPVSQSADGSWGFEGRVAGGKEYFFERSGFSPLSILKNPMILLALVSMGIVFGMPYLMDNMDPEMRAEFEERQKTSPLNTANAANPLQSFDAAAWLAGTGGKKDSTSSGAAQGKITR